MCSYCGNSICCQGGCGFCYQGVARIYHIVGGALIVRVTVKMCHIVGRGGGHPECAILGAWPWPLLAVGNKNVLCRGHGPGLCYWRATRMCHVGDIALAFAVKMQRECAMLGAWSWPLLSEGNQNVTCWGIALAFIVRGQPEYAMLGAWSWPLSSEGNQNVRCLGHGPGLCYQRATRMCHVGGISLAFAVRGQQECTMLGAWPWPLSSEGNENVPCWGHSPGLCCQRATRMYHVGGIALTFAVRQNATRMCHAWGMTLAFIIRGQPECAMLGAWP